MTKKCYGLILRRIKLLIFVWLIQNRLKYHEDCVSVFLALGLDKSKSGLGSRIFYLLIPVEASLRNQEV